jgi:hypothetical protein
MRALVVVEVLLLLFVPAEARAERTREGSYGGLAFAGSAEPFGAGNELERSCTDLGAASCSTPAPLGGGLVAYAGWIPTPDGLGFELMLASVTDYTRPGATYDGVPHTTHGNPLFAEPARDETFIILRTGVALAPRVRVWLASSENLAWSFAGGVGLAWRYMALEREVTSVDGLEDRPYFSRGTSYISPGLSLDASALLRATPTLSVAIGLGLWAETAWGDARSVADPTRMLEGNGKVAPVNTPAYLMAHGLQLFVMPYVGLAFGP